MKEEIIQKFVPSKEMADYLVQQELKAWQIVPMVFLSDESMESKRDGLSKLYEIAEKTADEELMDESQEALTAIEVAQKVISQQGIYAIETAVFDETIQDIKYEFENIVDKVEDVCAFEQNYRESMEYEADELFFVRATKWIKNEEDKYFEAGEFFIYNGEIRFWNLNYCFGWMFEEENTSYLTNIYNNDLNLPVPFKAGDIVEIDFAPFGPKKRGLIITIGDNQDCCCIQILSPNSQGKWNMGALKHGVIGDYNCLTPSPLYSLKKYDGDLAADEEIMYLVKEYMAQYDDIEDILFYMEDATVEDIKSKLLQAEGDD